MDIVEEKRNVIILLNLANDFINKGKLAIAVTHLEVAIEKIRKIDNYEGSANVE